VHVETGAPRELRIVATDGRPIGLTMTATGGEVALTEEDVGRVLRFENRGGGELWFRLGGVPAEQAWVASSAELSPPAPPAPANNQQSEDLSRASFVAGKFGMGIVVTPDATLTLPDHSQADGVVQRFFDLRQGTLEFWIKTLWDPRLRPSSGVRYLSNGLIDASVPWKLPYREWAHVALVWRPLKEDREQVVLHVYVNGLDHAYYRSTHWEGYGNRPLALTRDGKWLERFVSKAPPGTAFALDELRLSSTARYADLDIEFGGQQTVNPFHFAPSGDPFRPDDDTQLLFHFDDDLRSDPVKGQPPLRGEVLTK
jgi:hypothetical protein